MDTVVWQSIVIALMLVVGFGVASFRLATQPWPTYPVLVKVRSGSVALFAFRIAAFVLFVTVLVIGIVRTNWFDLVYYTYWNFTLQTMYLGAAIYDQWTRWAPSTGDETFLPLQAKSTAPLSAHRLLNTVFDVCLTTSVLVTLVFWLVLYNPTTAVWTTYVVHAVNLVLLLVEFALNEHLVQRHHMKFVVMWPALYGAITWFGHATYLHGFWPYDLLDVAKPYAPLKWLAISLGHAACFGLALLLSHLKLRYMGASGFQPIQ
ncbi:Aste57867_9161 [Aphanomyces stellatus]|uniref:Aste57867_9161 protein n=1 Tax=Aphanomyces stellatus TaxID=120398 RepID=A0A485KM91_9STRA|nr:hypothetical protein As57867_009125 [Aphanomyces stellatus]VFT86045.1 Aste57867_9161 [Aphanomyces stellatus]